MPYDERSDTLRSGLLAGGLNKHLDRVLGKAPQVVGVAVGPLDNAVKHLARHVGERLGVDIGALLALLLGLLAGLKLSGNKRGIRLGAVLQHSGNLRDKTSAHVDVHQGVQVLNLEGLGLAVIEQLLGAQGKVVVDVAAHLLKEAAGLARDTQGQIGVILLQVVADLLAHTLTELGITIDSHSRGGSLSSRSVSGISSSLSSRSVSGGSSSLRSRGSSLSGGLADLLAHVKFSHRGLADIGRGSLHRSVHRRRQLVLGKLVAGRSNLLHKAWRTAQQGPRGELGNVALGKVLNSNERLLAALRHAVGHHIVDNPASDGVKGRDALLGHADRLAHGEVIENLGLVVGLLVLVVSHILLGGSNLLVGRGALAEGLLVRAIGLGHRNGLAHHALLNNMLLLLEGVDNLLVGLAKLLHVFVQQLLDRLLGAGRGRHHTSILHLDMATGRGLDGRSRSGRCGRSRGSSRGLGGSSSRRNCLLSHSRGSGSRGLLAGGLGSLLSSGGLLGSSGGGGLLGSGSSGLLGGSGGGGVNLGTRHWKSTGVVQIYVSGTNFKRKFDPCADDPCMEAIFSHKNGRWRWCGKNSTLCPVATRHPNHWAS